MDFFSQFFSWLDGQLLTIISDKVHLVASLVEPAVVTTGAIYVLVWGWMSITGAINENVVEGIKRVLFMIVIFGAGLQLWSYNEVFVDTFYSAPDQLAAGIVGAPTTVQVIDKLWIDGNLVAEQLLRKGSVLSGDFAYYLAGFGVYLIVGATVVYTAFLLALSKVAVALILALGPVFIGLLFFKATRRFFESWIAQLANYALITILALFAAAFMLNVVSAYGKNAVAVGSGVTIAESVRFCAASALVLLVLRQVPAIAAGLASGVALSSFNAVSSLVSWGLGTTKRAGHGLTQAVAGGLGGDSTGRSTSPSGGKLIPRERVFPPPSYLRRQK